jgi:hypothetical protein
MNTAFFAKIKESRAATKNTKTTSKIKNATIEPR